MLLRFLATTTMALLVAVGTPVVAQAAEGDGSILVIMDVSGSMQRADASGTTLIAGARTAIRDLVDSAPDDTPVGLRLYGNSYPGNNQGRGCRDTDLAVPIGPLTSTGGRIERAIGAADPTGFTPIGYSLSQAANDFPPEGQRTIVLVSDGEDTCNTPPPCAAARQLQAQGIDVQVDTVGLFLQGNVRATGQLECIARVTGGSYYPADDTEELTEQLSAVSQRAVQRFETSGEPIVGGPAATQAAAVEPGQAYSDDIAIGEAKWYSFEAQPGQEVTVTVTEDGAAEYGCCMFLRLLDPDLEQLDSENNYNNSGTAQSYRVGSRDGGLTDAGTHYVEVAQEADGAGVANLEIQVDVSEVSTVPSESPSESPTASPSESPSASESASAAPEAAEVAVESDDGGNGFLWLIIGVLAVLVLGLGAAVAVLFRKVS